VFQKRIFGLINVDHQECSQLTQVTEYY